ncbi:uncharacterized [Tachysurus ichikawai]
MSVLRHVQPDDHISARESEEKAGGEESTVQSGGFDSYLAPHDFHWFSIQTTRLLSHFQAPDLMNPNQPGPSAS